MASVDKAKFLKRLSGGSDSYSEPIPGEPSDEPMTEESDDSGMTCGQQLKAAIDAGDTVAIDDALREAVRKYSGA